ncbi:tripartite tricarboxylate transporter TctB family protein [Inquilinus limosus]|uniref:DUF1468 domain-containing protein n=1 Tax=Inquilinus limosus TaxID=171674 RepID=A0A211ZV48_9PROT|nr:tripartite tricarboxylate transporter TctB family protein [Inquilinus limosus]OWJ69168.1 hypothetical protein BWR60_01155 [Inquilinus limosus]
MTSPLATSRSLTLCLSKNLWSGALFVAAGLIGLVLSQGYALGTASKMGPGYFPTLLSGVLTALGAAIAAKGVGARGRDREAVTIDLAGLCWIAGSIVVFATLFQPLGLIVASFLATLVASRAARDATWRGAIVEAALLSAVAWLLFIEVLHLPFEAWPPVLAH